MTRIEELESMSPGRILVVDDEPTVLTLVRQLLASEGYDVCLARTGRAALEALSTQTPQMVLTDVQMPDMDGLDILKATLTLDPHVPVILMSAHAELDQALACMREGAFCHVQKPLIRDEFLAACDRALETRRLRLQNKLLRQQIAARVGLALPSSAPAVRAEVSNEQRPERAAMERATLARVTRFVSEAIAKAPTRVLEQALAEPATPEVLTDVVTSVLFDDSAEGEWAAALLQGARVQKALLEEAGGGLSAQQVTELLGIGRAAVDKRRRQGALLGLKLPSGDVVYPAAQFGPRDVVPGLPDVLAAFRIRDPWMQLDLLLARQETLGGRNAFDALKEGATEEVKRLVASVGDQGL